LTEIAFEYKLNTDKIFEDEVLLHEEKLLLFYSINNLKNTIEQTGEDYLYKYYIENVFLTLFQ